jgi:hypothetical protein
VFLTSDKKAPEVSWEKRTPIVAIKSDRRRGTLGEVVQMVQETAHGLPSLPTTVHGRDPLQPVAVLAGGLW